jgi:hypothetical protein
MSSAKVTVTVRSRAKVVDGPFSRPVRLTPTGHAGVVYAGEVYPLHASNVIDLEDAAYSKYECDEFVEPGTRMPYAPVATKAKAAAGKSQIVLDDWNVEHNRFGNYLVFDADPPTAQATANLMVEIGLGVRRWDESERVSADGKQYGWFIRLEYEGTEDETRRRIKEAVNARDTPARKTGPTKVPAKKVAAVSAPANPSVGRSTGTTLDASLDLLKTLSEAVLALRRQLDEAEKQRGLDHAIIDRFTSDAVRAKKALANAQSKAHKVADRVTKAEAAERHLMRELDGATQQREQVEARARALENAPRAPSEAAASKPVKEAVDAVQRRADGHIAKANGDRDAAVTLMDEQAKRNDELQQKIDSLGQNLGNKKAALKEANDKAEILENRLSEVENGVQEQQEVQRATKPNVPRGVSAETFLSLLLSRLNLDRLGLSELLEFDAPRDVIEVLLRLDKGETMRAEKFEGIRDGVKVLEVKERLDLGGGAKGGMGRVYYHDPGDARLTVLVQRKKDKTSQTRAVRAFAERCRRIRNSSYRS